MTTAPRMAFAAVIAAALALTACAGDAGGLSPDGGVPTGCETDDDCPTGVCQFGICADESEVGLEIALLVEPPAFRSEVAPLHVTRLPVTLGRDLPDFALREPTPVRGVILFNAVGEDVGTPVEAEVRFVATRGIPGFEVDANTRSNPLTGEYEVALPPGAYDVFIEPDRADVSRTTALGVEIGSASEFKPFSIPAPSQYRIVSGVVERQTDAIVPVAGAKVFARTVDGRQESTVDVTADDGRFVLLVPPAELPYEFHVRPTEGASWVPSAVFEPVILDEDALVTDLRLSLGSWEEPVSFTIRVATPDGAPVRDALVSLRSQMAPAAGGVGGPDLASGRYTVSLAEGALDDEGRATVALPAGRAEIYAAPLDPALGLGVPVVIAVGDDLAGTTVPVVVEQRHRVAGRVVDSAGTTGVADAAVLGALRSTDLLPIGRYPMPATAFGGATTTGPDGSFVFLAQPGTWDVMVEPPVESGSALALLELVVGRGPVDDVEIVLPQSGVVRGRILDADNAPLTGATVRAFLVEGENAIPLGSGVTDGEGVYRLVLPVD